MVVCEPYTDLYGSQRSMLDLYGVWQRQGRYRLHFVHFVEGPVANAVRALGIPSTRLPVGKLLGSYDKRLLNLRWFEHPLLAREMLGLAASLRRFLVERRVSLLHCNNDRAGLMASLGARWARCPMVTHIRSDRSFPRLQRLVYHLSPEVVWVADRVRDDFAARHRLAAVKGRVIHNGRSLADNDGSPPEAVRAELGLPGEAVIALTVASFDERKGHETLIDAARIVCAEDRRVHFVLAGADLSPGQERWRRIRTLAGEAGLSSRVSFLGYRADVSRLMRGADVMVHPAHDEPLSGSLIEAIGYGLPCVATDTGGTAAIVPAGVAGYLVPPGDSRALARALLEMTRDVEGRRALAANARRWFQQHFTIELCAERTGAFFDEIMGGRSAFG